METSCRLNQHLQGINLLRNGGLCYKYKPLPVSYSRNVTVAHRLSISMRIEGSSKQSTGSEIKTTLKHAADKPIQHIQGAENPSPYAEQVGENLGKDAQVPAEGTVQQKKAAKIHDFCFGIPFGGLVLSGGLAGFLFSRNPTTLTTGVLFGGALMALSITSLKVWRQGKSSLPFILGQSVIAAALLRSHFLSYSLTKKLFPAGFYVFMSAAMLCFYTYVILSGGNPPPKKSKLATSPSS